MADGGYDSLKLRQQIEKQGAIACIPRHRNRKIKFPFDKEQYIATRFDKLSCRYLAFIHLACILIWLK